MKPAHLHFEVNCIHYLDCLHVLMIREEPNLGKGFIILSPKGYLFNGSVKTKVPCGADLNCHGLKAVAIFDHDILKCLYFNSNTY